MASSSVQAVIRIRPNIGSDKVQGECVRLDGTTVALIDPASGREKEHFVFDACHGPDSQQRNIFESNIAPLLEKALKGENVTVFAYGHTGAGKTHTMQGTTKEPGVIPRVVEHLFKVRKAAARQEDMQISMSFLEIYNEKVYDLLDSSERDLPIRETRENTIFIPGLSTTPLSSEADFQTSYAAGCKARSMGPTRLNEASSRSHAIVQLLVQKANPALPGSFFTSKLNLIDLAGSEDNRRTENSGTRLVESGAINKSLFVLGNVVNALHNNSPRVPYRDSKLTRFLQDSLGGTAHAMVIANVTSSPANFHETINTLGFAAKSRQIVNKPFTQTIGGARSESPVETGADRKAKLMLWMQQKNGAPGLVRQNSAGSNKPARLSDEGARPSAGATVQAEISTAVTTEVEKKFAELSARTREMMSPMIRGNKFLGGSMQARLEAVEQHLASLAFPKTGDASVGTFKAPAEPKAAPVEVDAGAMRAKEAKTLVEQAKALKKEGKLVQSLALFRQASQLVNSDKLHAKVAELEALVAAQAEQENAPMEDVSPPPAKNGGKKRKKLADVNEDEGSEYCPTPEPAKKKRKAPNGTATPPASATEGLNTSASDVIPMVVSEEWAAMRDQVMAKMLAIFNFGSVADMKELKGIGDKRAQSIAAYRAQKGGLGEDLLTVRADGMKAVPVFSQLSDLKPAGFTDKFLANFVKLNALEKVM